MCAMIFGHVARFSNVPFENRLIAVISTEGAASDVSQLPAVCDFLFIGCHICFNRPSPHFSLKIGLPGYNLENVLFILLFFPDAAGKEATTASPIRSFLNAVTPPPPPHLLRGTPGIILVTANRRGRWLTALEKEWRNCRCIGKIKSYALVCCWVAAT